MTQEEKQLLLQDLCARLPYGVKLRYVEDLVVKKESHIITLNNIYLEHILNGDADIKSYLRPMSSMTKNEMEEYNNLWEVDRQDIIPIGKKLKEEYFKKNYDSIWEHPVIPLYRHIDWLNSHHFDYRGLIEKGLALEAPEGMYNTKTK